MKQSANSWARLGSAASDLSDSLRIGRAVGCSDVSIYITMV